MLIGTHGTLTLLVISTVLCALRSPYLVQLYDCYYKDHEAWLVMDYCGGGSASDVIEACQVTFAEEEVREAVAWSLLGLHYLHSSRKLHRDVKVTLYC
jgi:serine/threonine protein kinase